MRTRQEIKADAKQAVAQQRGTAILLLLLPTLVAFVAGILSTVGGVFQSFGGGSGPFGSFGFFPFFSSLASTAISILITVLTVNICGSFYKIYRYETVTAGEPFSELSVNFARKLGGSLWAGLFVVLWSLLLIIPGIIKGYSYYLTSYILAVHPNVRATDALKLSMRMTKGHKGKLFVMHLSFIGWAILSCLTFGILAIVYVGPYVAATEAGFFSELRNEALASGIIDSSELD